MMTASDILLLLQINHVTRGDAENANELKSENEPPGRQGRQELPNPEWNSCMTLV